MEQMQDKEFDRQVREKLEGLNPAVPLSLWEKIEAGLETEASLASNEHKRGGGLLFWWTGIAASLLILGFGWWAYRPTQVIYLKGPARTTAVQPVDANKITEDPELPEVIQEKAGATPSKSKKTALPSLANNRPTVRKKTAEGSEAGVEKEHVTMLTEETEVPHAVLYPQLAKVSLQRTSDDKPAVKQHLEEVSLLAASDAPAPEEPATEPSAEQRPFGVSSILNFVVKSVDPGEKKVITFTEDREGTLNIGFNKIFATRKNKTINRKNDE